MVIGLWSRTTGRVITTVALAIVALAPSASAQVGLSSGVQSVALLARVPARASLPEVIRRQSRSSRLGRETSVTLRLEGNTGYRLLVRGAPPSGARIYVRASDGKYHELVAGAPIVVARDTRGRGEWEREVQYRIESAGHTKAEAPLPVQYEIAVDPRL
jgi:hypothetical protein